MQKLFDANNLSLFDLHLVDFEMFKCRLCGKEFKFQYLLKAHLNSIRKCNQYHCVLCKAFHDTKEKLLNHKKSDHRRNCETTSENLQSFKQKNKIT